MHRNSKRASKAETLRRREIRRIKHGVTTRTATTRKAA